MKFHVNPETGKASRCQAKVKCRFGGESGNENHYPTHDAAKEASEKAMSEKYGSVAPNATTFAKTKKEILAGLVKNGVVADASALPAVRNKQEMIDKWFNGDEKKFELVARISKVDSKLKDSTKKSLGQMMNSGLSVNLNTGSYDKPEAAYSDVELLDEETAGLDLAALRSGNVKAF